MLSSIASQEDLMLKQLLVLVAVGLLIESQNVV